MGATASRAVRHTTRSADVLILEQYGVRAGGQVVAEQLARHVSGLGGTVVLAAPAGPWPAEDGGFRVSRHSAQWWAVVPDVRRLAGRLSRGSLVVANGPRVLHHALLLSLVKRGLRTVLYLHNEPHRTRWAPLQKAYLRWASRFFSTRVVVADVLSPLVADPVSVLHNCCRAELEMSADEIRRNFDHGRPVTVKMMGRADPVKGLQVLEAAVSAMSVGERGGAGFAVAVGRSLHDRDSATDRRIPGITYVGSKDASWFAPGDVVCVPSLLELSPLVVLEAMARGGLVITTTAGGTPEIVDHGVTGFLVPGGDSEALRRCLASVIGMPASDRLRITLAARAKAELLSREWRSFWTAQVSLDV